MSDRLHRALGYTQHLLLDWKGQRWPLKEKEEPKMGGNSEVSPSKCMDHPSFQQLKNKFFFSSLCYESISVPKVDIFARMFPSNTLIIQQCVCEGELKTEKKMGKRIIPLGLCSLWTITENTILIVRHFEEFFDWPNVENFHLGSFFSFFSNCLW